MFRTLRLVAPALALIVVGFVVGGLANQARAAEPAYFHLTVGDLKLDNSASSKDENLQYNWRLQETANPYVVLDVAGEAYWYPNETQRWMGFRLNDDPTQRGHIAVRVPDGAKGVSGRFFYPKQDNRSFGITKFSIEADKASPDRRKDFFEAKIAHFEKLQSRRIPGTAWFRHERRAANIEWLGKVDAASDANRPRNNDSFHPGSDFDDTYSLFSGNRAVSENLQLDRELPPERAGDNKDGGLVELKSIEGVTVKEIDWKPLLKDKNPALDPLAASVPADQHVVFFHSFEAMMMLADEADRQGTPLVQLAEPQSQQVNVLERYQRQIGLGRTAIGRMLGPQVIKSVALTGGDAYLRVGSDIALIFEPQDLATLQVALNGQITMNTAGEEGVFKRDGEYAGVAYSSRQSPNRRVCSVIAVVGKNVIVTNSLAQMKKLIDVQQGKLPAIDSLDEYKFFRDRYKLGEGNETAFLFLSDATIRRWCGPKWRIADSRRVRDLAVMSELQAANLTKLVTTKVEPGPIYTDLVMANGGDLRLTARGVLSTTMETLEYMTPINELEFDRVTKAEATAYERWRDGYQRNFSWAFDPIALRIGVDEKGMSADLTVMPLIDNTEYREAIAVSRGAKLTDKSADKHDTVVQIAFALNKDSATVKQYAGMTAFFAPQLKADVLSWFGTWITVYADESPLWGEISKLKSEKEMEEFVKAKGFDLPVAISFEVSSAFKATAFLVAVRAFIEQTGPGMTIWETKQHGDDAYVKISPTAKAVPRDRPESKISIYYALSSESLTISPNEKLIQDVLARKAKRDTNADDAAKPAAEAKPTDDKKPEAAAAATRVVGWLGENLCAEASSQALQVFETLSSREYRYQMQRMAWDNLPILNEWRRRFPDQDPVALHERWWGVRLTCPGGGKYVWNEEFQTLESTAFGHPGAPKLPDVTPSLVSGFTGARFGLTFEEQGLRARAEVSKKK